jgi:pimeloyl-ACP methyl ester carboxylesterase
MLNNLFKKIIRNPLLKKSVRYIHIGYTIITLMMILIIFWFYQFYFSGPNAFQVNENHPFKSVTARKEYLSYYDRQSKEWPLKSEEKMISTSYGETFVRISGPEEGPNIVLLPGGGTSSLMWKSNIAALSENYRTYAIDDIYDWGRSIYKKRMCCSESVTSWLDELFTALDLGDSVILIGASYGAWKVSQYLVSYPVRVEKAVLLCPAYTVYQGNKEFEKRVFRGFIPLKSFMKRELYWTCEDLVRTDEGRRIADNHLDGLWLALRSFKTKIPPSMTVLSDEELRSIEIPVLYLAGENEKMYSVKRAVERLNSIAPNIQTEVIPNTGHCLMLAHPDIVNEKILEFLDY